MPGRTTVRSRFSKESLLDCAESGVGMLPNPTRQPGMATRWRAVVGTHVPMGRPAVRFERALSWRTVKDEKSSGFEQVVDSTKVNEAF